MRRTHGAVRLAAATVLMVVFLGTVPAMAAERPGRTAVPQAETRAQAGSLAEVRLWLGGLMTAWRLGLLTAAGMSAGAGEEGLIIDPDGFRNHGRGPSTRSDVQGDENNGNRTSQPDR